MIRKYLEVIHELLVLEKVWEQELVQEVRQESIVEEGRLTSDRRPRGHLTREDPPVLPVGEILVQSLGGRYPGLGVDVPARIKVVGLV